MVGPLHTGLNNNDTRSRVLFLSPPQRPILCYFYRNTQREPLRRREVLFEPCLLRLLQRRKSRLEVRIRNKSVYPIIVGYLGAVYSSIVLGNHPVPVKLWKLRRIFLLRVFVKCCKTKVRKQKIYSQVGFECSPCTNKVRSAWAGFCFIETINSYL